MSKISVIIPVYFNEKNLRPLYEELKEKFIDVIEDEYELVFVNDGSKDGSYQILKELSGLNNHIKVVSLSRNFGSHSAILCGLNMCTGDCAIVKAADLQEPVELMFQMIESWKKGNNVVLAVRNGRDEAMDKKMFANLYYWMVRNTALPAMPKGGFDVYLIDRKVIHVLTSLDETDSALTGQILWCGFKTDQVYYRRLAREEGKSRWTLKKKVNLVMDTFFSFSTLPITLVTGIGLISSAAAMLWAIVVLAAKLRGLITVSGWTTLFIFNLFSFGAVMFTLGILGNYLWRTFNASRQRPPYIIEEIVENGTKNMS